MNATRLMQWAVIGAVAGGVWYVADPLALGANAGVAEETVIYQGDDRLGDAALAARDTLPLFFENVMEADGTAPPNALVKVAFPVDPVHGDGAEIMWVSSFAADGDGYSGLLGNDAEMIAGMTAGKSVNFSGDDIRDWMFYTADNVIYGGYTTRAMLDDVSPETAAALAAQLSESPVPSAWRGVGN